MALDNSNTKAVACDHPQKGVNYHFSLPQLDKPYVIGKLSISEAKRYSLSMIGPKIKNNSFFKFLPENLENLCSTELYHAHLEGSAISL